MSGWLESTPSNLARRHVYAALFRWFCAAMTLVGVIALVVLL